MIIFFGPAGAGKSIQGQILAARYDWRWLSAGQLLRDMRDPSVAKQMAGGDLVDANLVNRVVSNSLASSKDVGHVILDGYPRELPQAKWLIESQSDHGRAISMIIVLEVPEDELYRRLKVRGRADDTKSAAQERLKIYKQKIHPIIDYFRELKVPIVHINGVGTVGEVHDRIVSELEQCSLV